ncbi:SCO family protein [Massilia sp. SM-13]|uniref:SCO family protein n=1 Tax=Pseudoduganella rhizocola TaxID=3382643 RepID=UPI0038B5C968
MRRLLCGAVLIATGAAWAASPAPRLKAGTFEPARMAPEIVQKAADGSTFKLSALRGKVVVLEFGFTHCYEVCPVSLAMLAEARKRLGADAAQLQVVFISVDPERDTPERMKSYLAQFDKAFIGLTGTPEQMAAIRKDYGITATKHPTAGSKTEYQMGHSSYLYFVDKQGKLRALMPYGRPAADIVHDVQLLAKE